MLFRLIYSKIIYLSKFSSLFILAFFMKKPIRRILLYIDYQKLNTMTIKNQYFISFIKKTFAYLKGTKTLLKLIYVRYFIG